MTEKTFNKYKLVIDEWFINGFNGAAAYRKYYPRSKRADDSFSKIQRIPEVQEYIKAIQEKAKEYTEITQEEILKELESFAMLDITDVLTFGEVEKTGTRFVPDPEHTPKKGETQKEIKEEYTYSVNEITIQDFANLPPEIRRAIKSLKHGKHGIEIEFFDKVKAFEMINKHQGFYEKDNNQKTIGDRIMVNMSEYEGKK